MTSELTVEQHTTRRPPGHLVALAGAGTGKTQMLSGRYLEHLHHHSPLEVVAVTFTERAAAELRARIRTHAARQSFPASTLAELDAAPIGTIHALASRICLEHPLAAGMPEGFSVMDSLQTRQWRSRHLPRAIASLETLPPGMSYTQLSSLLTTLLEDPYATLRSLPDDYSMLEDTWRGQLAQARRAAWAGLRSLPDWQQAHAELLSWPGPAGDRLEELRAQVVTTLAQPADLADEVMAAARVIHGAKLTVGSKKAWGDEPLKRVKAAIDMLRELVRQQVFLPEWNEQDDTLLLSLPALADTFRNVHDQLLQWRREQGVAEFADLEGGALRALEDAGVRAYYQSRFKAILVDECQDTSPAQAHLLEGLSGGATRTYVGDPLQAIYGFRTGHAPIHEEFEVQVARLGGSSQRLIHSHRAHVGLIRPLNRAMTHLTRGAHVELTASRAASQDEQPLHLLHVPSGGSQAERLRAEALLVTREIQHLLAQGPLVFDPELDGDRPLKPSDVVILARTWRPLDAFQSALLEAGTPAFLAGGGHLLQTREAQDAWVLLRAAGDPADDLATAAVLRGPLFGWNDRELHDLWLSRLPAEPWQAAILRSVIPAHQRARRFFQQLRQVRQAPALETLVLADRYGYRTLLTRRPDAPRALADWDALFLLITQQRDTCPTPRAAALRLRRWREDGVRLPRPPIAVPDAVTLSSIHHAKGLEWPVVFIVDLDGTTRPESDAAYVTGAGVVFPPDSWSDVRPAMFDFARHQKKHLNDQELDRLLYVASTRARERLYAVGPADSRAAAFQRLQNSFLAAGALVGPPQESHDHD